MYIIMGSKTDLLFLNPFNFAYSKYFIDPLAELILSNKMYKKFRMSLNFSKLATSKLITSNHHMHNLYTKFIKILGICKQFSNNLVNEQGNVPRRGPVPKFSDLEIVGRR